MSNYNSSAYGSQSNSAPTPDFMAANKAAWERAQQSEGPPLRFFTEPDVAEVQHPSIEKLADTLGDVETSDLHGLRLAIDKSLAKRFESCVNAPRPLPALNTPCTYEFPTHCLGEKLETPILSIAEVGEAHPDIAAHAVMGAVSLAMQGHVDVWLPHGGIPKGKLVPSSLFLATVAGSSDRKSTSDYYALRAVDRWESELAKRYKQHMPLYEIQFRDWEAKYNKIMKETSLTAEQKHKEIGIAPVKPTPPALRSDNPTVEGIRDLYIEGAKVLGLFSDDAGTFLGGHSMKAEQATNTIAVMSKMWEAAGMTKIRAGGNHKRLEKYRLAVHLMVQPIIAESFFNNPTYKGQGLLGRFLTAWPDNDALSGTRYSKQVDPIHHVNIKAFEDFLYAVLSAPLPTNPMTQGELMPRQLAFTPEAIELWNNWKDGTERHLIPGGKYFCIREFVGKCLEHAARYAANLEMCYSDATHISAYWFSRALEIIDYYINQAYEQTTAGNNPEFIKAHKLYNWLNDKREEEYVGTVFLLQNSPFRTSGELMPVIKTLEEHGLLQLAGSGHDVGGHFVKKAWRVNRGFVE